MYKITYYTNQAPNIETLPEGATIMDLGFILTQIKEKAHEIISTTFPIVYPWGTYDRQRFVDDLVNRLIRLNTESLSGYVNWQEAYEHYDKNSPLVLLKRYANTALTYPDQLVDAIINGYDDGQI